MTTVSTIDARASRTPPTRDDAPPLVGLEETRSMLRELTLAATTNRNIRKLFLAGVSAAPAVPWMPATELDLLVHDELAHLAAHPLPGPSKWVLDTDCSPGLPPPYTRGSRISLSIQTGERKRRPKFCGHIICDCCRLWEWRLDRGHLAKVLPDVVYGAESLTEDEGAEVQRGRRNLRARRRPIDVAYYRVVFRDRTRSGIYSAELSDRTVPLSRDSALRLLDRAYARRDLAEHRARMASPAWRRPKKEPSGWVTVGLGRNDDVKAAMALVDDEVAEVVEQAGGELSERDVRTIEKLYEAGLEEAREERARREAKLRDRGARKGNVSPKL